MRLPVGATSQANRCSANRCASVQPSSRLLQVFGDNGEGVAKIKLKNKDIDEKEDEDKDEDGPFTFVMEQISNFFQMLDGLINTGASTLSASRPPPSLAAPAFACASPVPTTVRQVEPHSPVTRTPHAGEKLDKERTKLNEGDNLKKRAYRIFKTARDNITRMMEDTMGDKEMSRSDFVKAAKPSLLKILTELDNVADTLLEVVWGMVANESEYDSDRWTKAMEVIGHFH